MRHNEIDSMVDGALGEIHAFTEQESLIY